MKAFVYMLSMVALLLAGSVNAEETAADARRHMVRGVAAIEMAKSNSELELAANEFRRATELDPALSAAWYNLASVLTKLSKYEDAIRCYRRYLELMPGAEDAMKVEDEIIKLEFRQEQATKITSMIGTWSAEDGTPYRLSIKGSRFTLATDHHAVTEQEVLSTYTLVGSVPVMRSEQLVFRLERTGSNLTGSWWHSGFDADKCKIPEESGEVRGEIRQTDGAIVLSYMRNRYRASTQMSIFDDFCNGVEVMEKRKVEQVFMGPLGPGIVGLRIGRHDHASSIAVDAVTEGSNLALAGLQKGDAIVAIDGVPLQELSGIEVWIRFRGEVGSEAVISVLRGEQREPVQIRVKRYAVEEYRPKAGE